LALRQVNNPDFVVIDEEEIPGDATPYADAPSTRPDDDVYTQGTDA